MSFTHKEICKLLEAKTGAVPGYPFGEGTRVYKVGGKMFALLAEDEDPLRINLKCDPNDALALRQQHTAIIPGYHMDKKHWNTVVMDGSLPDALVRELVDHSYDLIVTSLPKKIRADLDR